MKEFCSHCRALAAGLNLASRAVCIVFISSVCKLRRVPVLFGAHLTHCRSGSTLLLAELYDPAGRARASLR